MQITKGFSFEAAHFLPNYKGECSRLHGHSYKLFVTITAPIIEKTGMVVDFKFLKDTVQRVIIDVYDHQNLNNFFGNPTCEIMVQEFLERLNYTELSSIGHIRVRLYETEDSYAEDEI